MDKHEAKTLARIIRRKAGICNDTDVDVEFILLLISAPLVIIGLMSMVFEILTGLLVWKILMVMGTIIGGFLFYVFICIIGIDIGVDQSAEIAELVAPNIKDYDIKA